MSNFLAKDGRGKVLIRDVNDEYADIIRYGKFERTKTATHFAFLAGKR